MCVLTYPLRWGDRARTIIAVQRNVDRHGKGDGGVARGQNWAGERGFGPTERAYQRQQPEFAAPSGRAQEAVYTREQERAEDPTSVDRQRHARVQDGHIEGEKRQVSEESHRWASVWSGP